MCFSLKISEKGSFFKVENTDGFHVPHRSGGTGGGPLPLSSTLYRLGKQCTFFTPLKKTECVLCALSEKGRKTQESELN